MKNEIILVIDDDKEWAKAILRELGARSLPHKFCSSVDDALLFASASASKIRVALVDVMMPCGRSLDPKMTSGGLYTGVVLADEMSRLLPEADVILITQIIKMKPCEYEVVSKDALDYSEIVDLIEDRYRRVCNAKKNR